MPRYHFDLQHERDEFGIELDGVADARRYAYHYAGELIREIDAGARGSGYWRMDVREAGHAPAFSLVVELVPAIRVPAAREPTHGMVEAERRAG